MSTPKNRKPAPALSKAATVFTYDITLELTVTTTIATPREAGDYYKRLAVCDSEKSEKHHFVRTLHVSAEPTVKKFDEKKPWAAYDANGDLLYEGASPGAIPKDDRIIHISDRSAR